MTRVIDTSTVNDEFMAGLSDDERAWIYNGFDNLGTRQIKEILARQLSPEDTGAIYKFEIAMQAPAMAMMRKGFRVNHSTRLRLIAEIKEHLHKLGGMGRPNPKKPYVVVNDNALIQVYARGIWNKNINYNSPLQLQKILYDVLRVPVQYKFVKGKKKVSTDRSALENVEKAYPRARPFILTLLRIRDFEKKLTVLDAELDPDGRLRTSFQIGGTECLTGDHEVLTRRGWVTLKEWNELDQIVVGDGKTLWFDEAQKVDYPAPKELISIKTTRQDLKVTADHRIPWFTSKGNLRVTEAENMKNLHGVPVGGKLKGFFEPSEKTRACVMMQADGHVVHDKLVRFYFKKVRKVKRCEELLKINKLKYEIKENKDGTTFILVFNPPKWLKDAKYLGSWLLEHSPFVFCEEVVFWDGHKDYRGSETYYTTIKENAEWVKTMAHLTGRFASIRIKKTNEKWTPCWRVHITKDTTNRVHSSNYLKVRKTEKVYCAKTKPGFFLTRRNGHIILTGNTGRWSSSRSAFFRGTNLMNVTKELREIFIPDNGFRMFQVDLKGAESVAVGYLSGDSEYIKATVSGDPHTYTTKLVWSSLPWTGDLKEDRKIAEQKYYRNFTYRDLSKRGGHGTNYLGTPRTLAMQLRVEENIMRRFQVLYYGGFLLKKDVERWGFDDLWDIGISKGNFLVFKGAFPGIKKWHESTSSELQTKGYLTTPLGRKRYFWGRLRDLATLREAVAFKPQSLVADVLNIGLLNLYNELYKPNEFELFSQTYDSILGQIRIGEESKYIPLIKELVCVEVEINGKLMKIESDLKIGDNWKNVS